MKVKQLVLTSRDASQWDLQALKALQPHLVLVFGAVEFFEQGKVALLADLLPGTTLIGCSTAGEVSQEGVSDHSLVLTAVHFAEPQFRVVAVDHEGMPHSRQTGEHLGRQLGLADAGHVLLFGPGVEINGSALIEGLASVLPPHTGISGGLAADAGRFTRTWTVSPAGVSDQQVVALVLQGPRLQISCGSFGGWQPFGPIRRVTRSQGNILYELDGQPALDIYRKYLGDYADGLPGSGLLFPFSMSDASRQDTGVIRTILGMDSTQGSLTLAGDILPDGYLQLMHASPDLLIDGAQNAAEAARPTAGKEEGLAILISCVGRKLVLGGRVDEEVEAAGDIFGERMMLAGFYSNGEISPDNDSLDCRLHNQTMTITCLSEV